MMSRSAENWAVPLYIAPWPLRVAALARREHKTRFAGGRLGAMWAYITPVTWIAFVVLFYRFTGRSAPINSGLEIFVAVGFLPYVVFRQTISAMTRGLLSNRGMLVIRGVRVGDLLTASALQELFNTLLLMALIFGSITLMFKARPPADLTRVLEGLSCSWILGVGIGRFFAVLGLLSDTLMRLVPIALRPTFWISGIFYTSHELFGSIYNVLSWSPFLHATEILREGYFLGYKSSISDPMYVLIVALVPYVASFPLEMIIVRRDVSRYRS